MSERPSRPNGVTGSTGKPLAVENLPQPDTKRWIMRRKTGVVPELRAKLDGFLRNEDGISAVIFAICLPVLLATAALTIDLGYS